MKKRDFKPNPPGSFFKQVRVRLIFGSIWVVIKDRKAIKDYKLSEKKRDLIKSKNDFRKKFMESIIDDSKFEFNTNYRLCTGNHNFDIELELCRVGIINKRN